MVLTAADGLLQLWYRLLERSLTEKIITVIVLVVIIFFCWRLHVRAHLNGKARWGPKGVFTVWGVIGTGLVVYIILVICTFFT